MRRDHLLRAIRTIVSEALSALEREFAALYSPIGRPSIPPEKLLRAMLLQGKGPEHTRVRVRGLCLALGLRLIREGRVHGQG